MAVSQNDGPEFTYQVFWGFLGRLPGCDQLRGGKEFENVETANATANATGNATGNATSNATGNATGNATANAAVDATGNATANGYDVKCELDPNQR